MPIESPRSTEQKTSPSLLSEQDVYLFRQGTNYRLYDKLGAHLGSENGKPGAYFAVWAPHAQAVQVVGEFNNWDAQKTPLLRSESGIWECFVAGAQKGQSYKYYVVARNGQATYKADPFGFWSEVSPQTASRIWDLQNSWSDETWMRERREKNSFDRAMSIYEMHLGSWRRKDDGTFYSYRELAPLLVDYLRKMNYTHVEFMPLMEHPFYGSWGYQSTGYFAPTSRYGSPQDLMYLIDQLHQNGIGVILDWVPSHFATDEHGLGNFDGTHLFEHADPRQGFHPDWGSYIFNYGRNEVRSFLLSSAMFWIDVYHADVLRLDAVASMLYLDYSRKPGEWIPNEQGGRENLDAIEFLRTFNKEAYSAHPGIQTIAEESTAWPLVTRPPDSGGLGFGMKWDMGWMHDTLRYFSTDPIDRKFHQNDLTFRGLYAFTENFVLSLSHDEVVYGKGSLLTRMPGDEWQKFANMRLLYSYMYSQPGKKLLFMGDEFGQTTEWNHERSLEWGELESPRHRQLQRFLEDLNRLYRDEVALYQLDFDPAGFEWIDANDVDNSVLTYIRRGRNAGDLLVVVLNFTPVVRHNYRVGVPQGGHWREVFNSDAQLYGGSGHGNLGEVEATPIPYHGRVQSLNLTLPPQGALFLAPRR